MAMLVPAPSRAGEPLDVAAASAEEVVYSWRDERCERTDIPDTPLRAFRRADGEIVAFASHNRARSFVIEPDGRFVRDCEIVFESTFSSDPSEHADATWIAATWTADGHIVHALGHNEYRANRHWFACDYDDYLSCWYNSIVPLRSEDGGARFHRVNAAPVAAAPFRHDAHQGRPRGFFEPTNIIHHNGAWYALVYAAPAPGQRAGTCLLRTYDIADPSAWTMHDGTRFVPSSRDAYAEGGTPTQACAPLSALGTDRVGAVVRHEPSGLFVASLAWAPTQRRADAIGISVSRDLVTWSQPRAILPGPTIWSRDCTDTVRYGYPAILDLASADRNFSTADNSPHLYLTRLRVEDCEPTLDRDLVRIPLRIDLR
jgi:hypothetical protein